MSIISLGRVANPEDIAHAALYLASDESSMLTGTSIYVDGGRGIQWIVSVIIQRVLLVL